MIRLLRIRNFALIREVEIEFGPGLNLLTGETGSGKSILVDALGLLLGSRSSQEMIRTECDTAEVEGIFDIGAREGVYRMLVESGFEPEDNSLLIRREISTTGRNRIFVNDRLATLSFLKSIGEMLADIHGQQDQRSLLDLSTHLEWLDHFGGNSALRKEVRDSFLRLREIANRLESLESNEQERLRRIDILRFQIDEIRQINPQPNEREDLEKERNILSNRERILGLATEIHSTVYDNESSILTEIRRTERALQELERFDDSWSHHRESLLDVRYKLEDLAAAARDYALRSEFNPERLEQVQQRLYQLEKLIKKYGASIDDILEYAAKCEKELAELLSYSDSAAHLSEQFEAEMERYRQCADRLSDKRHMDALRLQSEIRKEFSALAMERMELHVYFHPRKESERKTRLPGFYGLSGVDHVEFLIAANKGEEARPLAKVASGGELSRLMLSIKSLCGGEDEGKILVFDEVDTGIGGRVADAVGRRLRDISRRNQVLCVTHLPQIAAFARNHFSVRKEIVGDRTETIVRFLKESERVQELSRMLGGKTITETTRLHALEMLGHSKETVRKKQG